MVVLDAFVVELFALSVALVGASETSSSGDELLDLVRDVLPCLRVVSVCLVLFIDPVGVEVVFELDDL